MVCEACQKEPASVHLTQKVPASGPQDLEVETKHHVCEECVGEFMRGSPFFNPTLNPKQPIIIDETCGGDHGFVTYAGSPGTRTERLRVEDISPERIVLKVINSEEVWTVLTSRLRGVHGWTIGTEIGMSLTDAALEWLEGRRDNQYE
jgi:hypothetical protein